MKTIEFRKKFQESTIQELRGKFGNWYYLKKLKFNLENSRNVINPQAHGGVIAFQGQSHRDWFEVELLALNFLRLLSGSKFVIKN